MVKWKVTWEECKHGEQRENVFMDEDLAKAYASFLKERVKAESVKLQKEDKEHER